MTDSLRPTRQHVSPNEDLLFVSLYVVLATAAFVTLEPRESGLRLLLGLPLVLIVPGYALVAAIFPGRIRGKESGEADPLTTDTAAPDRAASTSWLSTDVLQGISALERVALSILLSVVAVSTIGLVAAFTPWGITAGSMLVGIGVVTIVGILAAVIRRGQLPPEQRFRVSDPSRPVGLRSVGPSSLGGWILFVIVCASILAATVAVGYAWTGSDGDVEFYLLSEDESGDLVAGNYPDDLDRGEAVSLVTAVENHEGRTVEYTVVVTVERIGNDTPGGESDEVVLDRYSEAVPPGVQWTHRHDVPADRVTEDFRLRYYLYDGAVPEDPTEVEPRQELQLTVDVQSGS